MNTTLISYIGFNPYFLNEKQVNRIIFFNPSDEQELTGFNWIGNNNKHKTLVLPFEIYKARVLKLSRNDAFFMPCLTDKKCINIYIPTTLLALECKGEVLNYETTTERAYRTAYTFTAECTGTVWVKDDWGQCQGVEASICPRELTFYTNHRYERTDTGELYERLKQLAKTVGVELSVRDVEKLERVFNIEIK